MCNISQQSNATTVMKHMSEIRKSGTDTIKIICSTTKKERKKRKWQRGKCTFEQHRTHKKRANTFDFPINNLYMLLIFSFTLFKCIINHAIAELVSITKIKPPHVFHINLVFFHFFATVAFLHFDPVINIL